MRSYWSKVLTGQVSLFVMLLSTVTARAEAAVERRGDVSSVRCGELCLRLQHGKTGLRVCGVVTGGFETIRRDERLWSAEFRDTAGRRALVNGDMGRPTVRAAGRTVTMEWASLELSPMDRCDVRVTVVFVPERSRTEWRIAFTRVPPGWTLFQYLFPQFGLAADRGPACAFVEPCDWGTLTRDPLARLKARWRVYPRSSDNMQFYALQRGPQLVYLGCHDPCARAKEFAVIPDTRSRAITFGVTQTTRMRYGSAYKQSYPFVLQVMRGDWYDAAQTYRRWALSAPWTWRGPLHAGAKTPRRYIGTPLVLMRLGTEILDPAFVADWAIRMQKWFGVPVAYHWYAWHQDFGSLSIDAYPDYFPTRPGFRAALRRMRKAGIQVMPYLNARLWRTDFDSWYELGRRAAAKDPYGDIYREVWMKIPTAAMDPSSEIWQWVIGEAALRCVDCGCSAVYLDQLAESPVRPDYDLEHPHEPGETGAWVQGYWRLCERIRKEGRRIEPDLVLTAEGNAEPYIAGIDAFLTGNLNAPNSIPLYAAVYHDYVMQFGRYVMARDLSLPRAVLAKFGQQFIFGGQFGWSNGKLERFTRDNKPHAQCLRTMAKLRAAYADLLGTGRMLRPLDFGAQIPMLKIKWYQRTKLITLSLPQVLNSVWQRADGQIGLLLLNIGDADAEVMFALSSPRYPVKADARAVVHSVDGRSRIITREAPREGRSLRIRVPAATPLLVTLDGTPLAYPAPPAKPPFDLIGRRTDDRKVLEVLPFAVPDEIGTEPNSQHFPFRYEAERMPFDARPRWLLGPSRGTVHLKEGKLEFDTLTAQDATGVAARIVRGPVWDVDPRLGYTVEARLRVLACNDHPRFAFWLQCNTETGLFTLQVYPNKIVPQGGVPIEADMATKPRVVRVVGLPGGKAARIYLDGRMIAKEVKLFNGSPAQARLLFGAGASAGRIRAEVDYVRFHPGAALSPR